jgi:hypothetical protein
MRRRPGPDWHGILCLRATCANGCRDRKSRDKPYTGSAREAFIRRYVTQGGSARLTQTATAWRLLSTCARIYGKAVEELRMISRSAQHLSRFVGTPLFETPMRATGRCLQTPFKYVALLVISGQGGRTTIWERWDGWTNDKF